MSAHTFIASRDPVDGDRFVFEMAKALARKGGEISLFLVENGAFLARSGACGDALQQIIAAGVTVYADDFALQERGITGGHLAEGVQNTSLETLLDHLADGRKVTWH